MHFDAGEPGSRERVPDAFLPHIDGGAVKLPAALLSSGRFCRQFRADLLHRFGNC
jgi:hypothetical protein